MKSFWPRRDSIISFIRGRLSWNKRKIKEPGTGISEKLTISVSGSFILERTVSNIVYNLIEIMLKERKKSQFIMLSAHECAS